MKNSLESVYLKNIYCDFKDNIISEPSYTEHYHPGYEIALFVKANIKIFIKDTLYEIRNGDMIFINEYDVHRIIYTQNTRYSRYVLNFNKDIIKNFLKAYNITGILDELFVKSFRKINLNLKQQEETAEIMDSIIDLYTKSTSTTNDEINCALAACVIFPLLNSAVKYKPDISDALNISPTEQIIQRTINHIDENYADKLTLGEISDSLNISKYYISHIFKENTGFTLFEYIQHRRAIEAQRMLKDTDAGISDICYNCGFSNIQHFYKVFKKITKKTPGNYRKS